MQLTEESSRKAEHVRWLGQTLASFPSFCGLLQIQPKEGGGRIPLVFSPIQRRYNRARTARDIVLKPRQVHMTTLEAARDVWWFLTKPGARVVVVCQSQTDQAALKDIAYKFRLFFDSLQRKGLVLRFGTEATAEWTIPDRDATLRIIQAGASEASASKKGRGGTVNRLHISEAAFFERAEDTFNSLMESVPREGSEVVNESTPNGASGFFFDQWRAAVEGKSAYKPHFFPWWLHPDYRIALSDGERFEPRTDLETSLSAKGIPVECLKWYRWKVADKGGNADLVSQEFPSDPETCFLVSGRGFFDAAKVKELLARAQEPRIVQRFRDSGTRGELIAGTEVPVLRVWHEPEAGKQYVVAADPSEGSGGDPSAGIVLERVTGRHMATIWGQLKPWDFAKLAVGVARKYNNAVLAPERNNHGHAFIRAADAECGYGKHIFVDRDDKRGWLNHEHTRTPALDTLEKAIRAGHASTPDKFLASELRTFIVNGLGRAEASNGSHDDLVMAYAIAWDVICRPVSQQGREWISQLPHA